MTGGNLVATKAMLLNVATGSAKFHNAAGIASESVTYSQLMFRLVP
jgi:hypothetical protein